MPLFKHVRAKALLLVSILLCGIAAGAPKSDRSSRVVWFDNDSKDIPEPRERDASLALAFFNSQFAERWKRAFDVPRWARLAVGNRKKAANVNRLDEVPDSSWYTNRHALRRMTVEQLVRGPNRGNPPDLSRGTITKAKHQGVTPGLQLKDARGQSYVIKFDNKQYPELESSVEVIATKILYASGYNVPENYVADLDVSQLEIGPDVQIEDGGSKRQFTKADLDQMLERVARRPDGRYRVMASKLLGGKPKGPFAFVGLRTDDPNDLIPHEHRRELRGLRVIASWLNHWDIKEQNTLDMYVEEGGRKFLRHYLIDFNSALGGGKAPLKNFHGREYTLDTESVLKEIFTLGYFVSADEKTLPLVMPEVGGFSNSHFNPGDWKPAFRCMPFDNLTDGDAAWATRVILSFSEEELQAIIKTAEYSNPKAADYIFKTLLERRQMVARHWLRESSPLANFAIDVNGSGVALTFSDLLAANSGNGSAEHHYEIRGNGDKVEKNTSANGSIPLGKSLDGETEIKIRTARDGVLSDAVTVWVQVQPGGAYSISRIVRS